MEKLGNRIWLIDDDGIILNLRKETRAGKRGREPDYEVKRQRRIEKTLAIVDGYFRSWGVQLALEYMKVGDTYIKKYNSLKSELKYLKKLSVDNSF